MVCIVMLYGHIESSLNEMAQFLKTNYDFLIVPLPDLDISDKSIQKNFIELKQDVQLKIGHR